MTTIKSYTDLEQSKKLAGILPLESADMLWGYYYNGNNHCIPNIRPFRDGRNEIPKGYIPAWSLAALLEQLPYKVCDNYGDSLYLDISKDDDVYQLTYLDIYGENIYTDTYEHFIDACVAMIEKLHELKIL